MTALAGDTQPGAWRAVWIMVYVWAVAVMDRMILLLLMPGIKADLNLSDTEISLLHGLAFAVCFSIAGIPLGHLSDRANRRNLLIAGTLGWGLATMACGLTSSFTGFFVARMAVGVSQAVLAPAAISIIADYFVSEKRGKPTALVLASGMFGGAAANAVGGLMLDWFANNPAPDLPLIGQPRPWQAALLVAGLPSLLAAPLLLMMREPVREQHRLNADGSTDFSVLAHFRRHGALFASLFLAFVLIAVAGNGVGNWWPAVFMRAGGLSPTETGVLLGLLSVAGGVAAAVIGGFMSDWSARKDAYTGRLKLTAACLAGQAVVLLALFVPGNVTVVAVALAVSVVFSGALGAACYALLPDLVPPQGRGLLIAIYQMIGNLIGFGLGPTALALVTNKVLQDESRVADAMMLFGIPGYALAVIAALVAVPLLRRMRAGS
ncbi:MAG TPA: MFS transporter [Novosphingobium sp.]|nr:MFS transporter [Novosphingobium sp.]HMP55881.1 MFS transporter [Novosphingobium sp.]